MIEGLVFEERLDDAPFNPEDIDREYQMLVTEESWKDPETFGHIESPFENHIAMIAKRSQELGIVNEYSDELLALKGDLSQLQQTLISYDEFYQMCRGCPEELGMSQSFADSIFSSANSEHDDHRGHSEHDDHDGHRHKADDASEKEAKGRKKRARNAGKLTLGLFRTKTRASLKR